MAVYLVPDKIITASNGLTIKQKIIPDGLKATKDVCSYVKKGDLMKPQKPLGNAGKPLGITIHNTNNITTPADTNPAEQYTRATYNGNMGGVAVHFYVWKSEIWQNLAENEQGWHATDGTSRNVQSRKFGKIGGNLDTIAIEVIGDIAESENTAAKLSAYLCDKHGLDTTDIYQHDDFYAAAHGGKCKPCPVYIKPRWGDFISRISQYLSEIASKKEDEKAVKNNILYRVQIGAFSVKSNAESCLERAKQAGFSDAFIAEIKQ